MGLIQGVLEKAGIATVSITVLPEITKKVGPPRALSVDAPFGFAQGRPNDSGMQSAILAAALEMVAESLELPALQEFRPAHVAVGA